MLGFWDLVLGRFFLGRGKREQRLVQCFSLDGFGLVFQVSKVRSWGANYGRQGEVIEVGFDVIYFVLKEFVFVMFWVRGFFCCANEGFYGVFCESLGVLMGFEYRWFFFVVVFISFIGRVFVIVVVFRGERRFFLRRFYGFFVWFCFISYYVVFSCLGQGGFVT